MGRVYTCGKCGARLNPNVKIILRAEVSQRRALILLSPQPGNYSVIASEDFILRRNDAVRFSCPVCSADLTSAHDPGMAEIRFIGADRREGTVAFSRQPGHHATYVITEEKVRAYGEHAQEKRVNFWGVRFTPRP
jgi:predicted RNA-binding Zn-ribbon protein involved in translation (DUF1610 family)